LGRRCQFGALTAEASGAGRAVAAALAGAGGHPPGALHLRSPPRARRPAPRPHQGPGSHGWLTSSSRVLTVPATVARSYTCGSTTSWVATPRALRRCVAHRLAPDGPRQAGAQARGGQRPGGGEKERRDQEALGQGRSWQPRWPRTRAHEAAPQWLRTVCHTCAPRRCLSTALTQPRLPRRCLTKWAFGALYGTSYLPLRPRCAPVRTCVPHASGQGCCRRWRELGRVKIALHERRKPAAQRVGWASDKSKARGY